MAPKLHLIRHAEGLHNVHKDYYIFRDPLLTPKGKKQCAELQRIFPHHQAIELIVSSPIRRTLYTSLLSFKHDIEAKGLHIIALPELQETSNQPCDTGTSPIELVNEFHEHAIDFSLVQPGWNVKQGKWSAEWEACKNRAQEAREWLHQRPEREIVVVTHGAFLQHLTGDWADEKKFPSSHWANTESRTYNFDESRPGYHLIETEESARRRE